MKMPTLLGDCAHAATAAEARFRIDYPNSKTRASRVIALDDEAARMMPRLAADDWAGAHFLAYARTDSAPGIEALKMDATLEASDGTRSKLSRELDHADVVVMIASGGEAAEAAGVIGTACSVRAIMTAGLIVSADRTDPAVESAVRALRPHAAVLVVASDADYVPAMLRALRA